MGLETAILFAHEGARVAMLDRDNGALQTALARVPEDIAIHVDVSQEASVNEAVAEAARVLGGIDGVANVAGVATRKTFDETTLEIMMRDIGIRVAGAKAISAKLECNLVTRCSHSVLSQTHPR